MFPFSYLLTNLRLPQLRHYQWASVAEDEAEGHLVHPLGEWSNRETCWILKEGIIRVSYPAVVVVVAAAPQATGRPDETVHCPRQSQATAVKGDWQSWFSSSFVPRKLPSVSTKLSPFRNGLSFLGPNQFVLSMGSPQE
jgi:hypothetical protein